MGVACVSGQFSRDLAPNRLVQPCHGVVNPDSGKPVVPCRRPGPRRKRSDNADCSSAGVILTWFSRHGPGV